MAELLIFTLIPLLLLAISLRFFLRSARNKPPGNQALSIEEFLPVHHDQFEEVERRLSEYEAVLKRTLAERRECALAYLQALRGDFERVARLLNHAAKFLPELTLEGESERLWVGLRFRLECRLVRLQILLGYVPAARLKALTCSVRLLARRADQALNEIAREHGLRVLQSDLNT